MPRMTRAALKAQAQADDYPDLEQHVHTDKELESQRTPPALIHEDLLDTEIGGKLETNIHNADDLPVRQALRDITDENYPKADLNVETQSLSPVKHQEQEEEERESQKSTRKPRGKAKGRTKKKENSPTVVDAEEEVLESFQTLGQAENITDDSRDIPQLGRNSSQNIDQPLTEDNCPGIHEETSEPGPAIEEEVPEQSVPKDTVLKTPKFDPSVHLADEEARQHEDSFVQSIISRSPSKFGSSQGEQPQPETSQSYTDSLQAFTPLRRTSSTNFEESFEALDSLEDTIEQLTAGLPLLAAEEMHSPDSPIKTNRRSVRIEKPSSTPKVTSARTPRTNGSKLQSALRSQDKENTPPVARTPLKYKTPLKAKTPVTKETTPLKARTPAVRQSSPLKSSLSVKKTRTPAPNTASEIKPTRPVSIAGLPTSPTKAPRQSTMMANSVNKPQPGAKKPASTLQRKPSQRQASVPPTTNKTEPVSRNLSAKVQSDPKKAHQTSKSVSVPTEKQQEPNVHKRRVTSGNVLSTSKPAFVPAKSSKPPTVSTFALPGEAVAEKLKAQKEAREEKMKQPKVSIAEQKAAKLKADREAREERVRLNQLRAKEEAEDKENRKPQRPVSMSALTISKARAEAAERGRLASKEWAEKMLKKKAAEVKTTPVEAV